MSDPELADFAGLISKTTFERRCELERRLPVLSNGETFEDGFLTGLVAAVELLDVEAPGDASRKMRELLSVAASSILRYRQQALAYAESPDSPAFREAAQAEFDQMKAGKIASFSMLDILDELEAHNTNTQPK